MSTNEDKFILGGHEFTSRFILGSGKFSLDLVKACIEKGVLCLTAKDKVRLLPALNIPMEILQEAIEIIKTVCAE